MLERASARVLPVVNRGADSLPMATVCCNACRTCVTSNIVGFVVGGAVAFVAAARSVAARVSRLGS